MKFHSTGGITVEANVGDQEAAVRILFGAVALAFSLYCAYFSFLSGVYLFSLLTVFFFIISGLLITAVMKWCPLNEALNRDTRLKSRGSE